MMDWASSQGSSTVAYHLNAFTGAIIEPKANGGSINPVDGRHLFDGEPTQVFPLPIAHCKTAIRAVAVADKDGAVSGGCSTTGGRMKIKAKCSAPPGTPLPVLQEDRGCVR
jgi:hypothetical protein